MATVTTNNQYYTDIANAIRGKNGTETQYKPSEMAAAIQAISGGGEPEPPDDGKTRLYITVPANAMEGLPPPRNQVPLYIQQTVANGVTIDWGDGTAPETLPGTGAVNTTHAYAEAGDYVISLDPAEGCQLDLGTENGANCVMGPADSSNSVYPNMLQKVIINNTRILLSSAFYNCYSLASVVIPDGVTSIGSRAFHNCESVKEYHFLSPTPPSLSNTNAFSNIPSDCIIYVPVGSLQAYQTATNWATYADQMQEEPA